MRTNALRRAIGVALLLVVVALVAGRGGVVQSTFALFNGETQNAGSAFADGWIGPPTGLVATYSGANVTLNWTVGSPLVNTQTVLGYDGGTAVGGSCNALLDPAYTSISSIANNTTATYLDSSRATGINGHYFCYEVTGNSTTYGSWQSATTMRAQVGMVATAVSISDVATAGSVAATDQIQITWNQRTNIANTAGLLACVYTDGTILLGDTGNGNHCRGSGDGYTLAKLTSSAGALGTAITFNSTSVSSTTTAPFTTTITLGGSATTSTSGGAPTWTLTPSTTVASNTGALAACATASNCTPTTSSNF